VRDILQHLPEDQLKQLVELLGAHSRVQSRELASASFMTFVNAVYENFITGRHHKIMGEAFERLANGELKRLIVNMPPRHALVLTEEIPTTEGWKTVAAIEPGDRVFGPDGKPTLVTGKSPVYEGQLYEVTTGQGDVVLCDADHLWTVRFGRGPFHTYRTEDLWRRQQGERLATTSSGRVLIFPQRPFFKPRCPARLPPNAPLEYPRKGLPVDPYVLGVWLGDGYSRNGYISSHDNDASFIRAEFERRVYGTTDQTTKYTFGVPGLMAVLRDRLGVLGNKHIPEEYMTASVEQRWDLLRGLVDTDGSVSEVGQCSFSQKNRRLLEQVRELLNSLGIRNSCHTRVGRIGDREYGDHYRLSFYAKDCALLPRKRERTRNASHRRDSRAITFRKLNQTAPVQCIRVEREDGLFIVGRGCMVTHNTKSEFASYLLPAWLMGRNPKLKIIQANHNTELATRFGRKVRDIVASDPYRAIFPRTSLREDSKSAGKWLTSAGGEYYAAGVGAAITGRGADILVIDDPHSEQDALSPSAFDNTYEWYTSGPRQRLQPGGAIVLVMTRWGMRDLTGRLLKASKDPKADQWEVIEFPAILPSGEPLWPEFWNLKNLEGVKASLPASKWSAQWQQNPLAAESVVIRRDWWRNWTKPTFPNLKYVLQAYDTAMSAKETANYSAITTWGIFEPEEGAGDQIILLDATKGRWGFPELKAEAKRQHELWKPDMLLIEAKASGQPLADELVRSGLPAVTYAPGRGRDKITRMNMIAPLFEAGRVWAPVDEFYAKEVIDEVSSFPAGEFDDVCDTVSLALLRFRQGGFVSLPTDPHDEDAKEDALDRRRRRRRVQEYY